MPNTFRRIDTCRDILVGKVPDPKSQVEQITIAMIYKFMDDMDAEAEELGGKRTFFAGEYEKYGWSRLMAPNMGGFDVLALYSEAIQKMNENPGIPSLFRDIFKNAYLPYRDPETLRIFLKEIDGFSYDHSERLGDAFEYLLSVLGSQGDAGQFRTPRHIIDFMVAIIDPKKDESILDPACGTAGFLISAWKHILKNNTKKRSGDLLTPDERKRLAANIHGYDISPDMVRLSLVNMYLHGFTDPHIVEYDTLTSEERWNEFADVILANPPFMSPKGGIKPHKRFSVPSNRSEVLFVDYMLEHLTPNGRAAIIVPEGIIFQSGTAYKRLRETLLKEALIGVISLPSGVFQPYSGVKTSILILDKRIAKNSPNIIFSDIRAIGMSLGIKRTVTEQNDLPFVLKDYAAYYAGTELSKNSFLVDRNAVLANDSNLSAERYRPVEVRAGTRVVRLKEVCSLTKGSHSSTKTEPGSYPLIVTAKESLTSVDYQMEGEAVCVPLISSTGHGRASINRIHFASGKFAVANLLAAVQPIDHEVLNTKFLHLVLDLQKNKLASLMKGAANVSMKVEDLAEFQIPLPHIEIQLEIVEEIESYKKVICGARAVLDHYKPRISFQSDWPKKELGEVCRLGRGFAFKSEDYVPEGILNFRVSNIGKDRQPDLENSVYLPHEFLKTYSEYQLQEGDFVIVMVGATTGKIGYITSDILPALLNQNMWRFFPNELVLKKRFLYYAIDQLPLFRQGGARDYLTQSDFLKNQIPIPPLAVQQKIVAEIEAEQALVNTNRELVTRFEKKIQATLARVWGEDAV